MTAGVNGLFLDWSVRKVGLKELWTCSGGIAEFNHGRAFWTKAGGVQRDRLARMAAQVQRLLIPLRIDDFGLRIRLSGGSVKPRGLCDGSTG